MRRWQEVVNVAVGFWMILSPWILGFDSTPAALAVALVLGAALMAAALGALAQSQAWEEWSEVIVGSIAVASPWLIGMQSSVTFRSSAVVCGGLAILMAGWRLAADQQFHSGTDERISVR